MSNAIAAWRSLPPLRTTIGWFFVICLPVAANPIIGDPVVQMRQGLSGAFAAIALIVEIVMTAALIVRIFDVELRLVLVLVLGLLLLNAATFGIFVLWLYPWVENKLITELLIWLTESIAIVGLVRPLTAKPVSFQAALAIAFLGNLVSYLIGSAS